MNGDYIALAIAIAVSIYTFWSLFNNLIKARLIEDTPTSKIRSASQGYVELSGFCHNYEDNHVIAPLTGRPCLWYTYKIERYERSGKSSHWRTLESKTSSSFFTLRDDTGECAIDPRRADVSTSWTKTWRGNSRRPLNGDADHSLLGSVFGGSYRYTEKIIKENDYLYALGMFQSIHAPSAEQQQQTHTKAILNQWKQDYDQLVSRFDTNADGELDMQEWQAAREAAARQAHAYVLENYDDNPIHVMTYAPIRRKPYILSNHDPKNLTRKYRWRALGMLVLFIISAGVTVYLSLRFFQA